MALLRPLKTTSFTLFLCFCFNLSAEQPNANDCNPEKDQEKSLENSTRCENITHPTLIITNQRIPFADHKPTTQATNLVDFSKQTTIPNNLTSLVESLPGVAENGQPGLYQVISIRGVSRQRILTLFEEVRLTSERRAGVAASFIDPLILGNVQVTRGPVSTYYGSGAIGGVTQLEGDQSEGIKAVVGYKQLGNEDFQLLRWGDVDAGISFSNRQAGQSEDINRTPLNTHFTQRNLMLQKSYAWSDLTLENLMFFSKGEDLGRSNSRFPNRIVNIDDEKHNIFKTRLSHKENWSVSLYLHDQSTASYTLKPDISRSDLLAESKDYGTSWQTAWKSGDTAQLIGIDYFARRQVNIYESILDLVTSISNQQQTLKQGYLDELAVFYTQHRKLQNWRLQFGGRGTYENSGANLVPNQATNNSQTAITGFFGAAYQLSDHLEVNANLGNAFRFASLTERFFSGTTARGEVIGNPDLKAEKAVTFDLGFNASFAEHQLKLNFFANQFSHYIQRVQLSTEQLTYINQDEGFIKGLEAEYHYAFNNGLEFVLSGMAVKGENQLNQPLADIPSNRVNLQLFYQSDLWQSNLRFQHRFAKNSPASGEIATDSANILSFSLNFDLDQSWHIKLYGDNLFNQSYLNSADDLSTLASGRNFGISLAWQTH